MELTDKQIEHLEKSYFGTITESEQSELDTWLQNDAFRAEAILYLEAFEKVDSSVENELRDTFKIWEKRSFGRQMMNNSWMKIAASFFLIAVIGSLVYLMQISDSGDVSSFYVPYDNVLTTRGDHTEEQLFDGLEFYDNGAYEDAAAILTELDGEDAKFYLAQSYFANGEYAEAAGLFQSKLLSQGKYKEVSEWYAALSQFKIDQELGIKRLEQISTGGSSYADEAADFLLQK